MFNGQKSNGLNEPTAAHAKKSITFFSSFEEMENHQLSFYASQSPEELLRNHKILSMAAYGLKEEEEDASKMRRIIKFNKPA